MDNAKHVVRPEDLPPELRRMLAEAAQITPQATGRTTASFEIHFGYEFRFVDPGTLAGFLDFSGAPDFRFLTIDSEHKRDMFAIQPSEAVEFARQFALAFPGFRAAARKLFDDMDEADGEEPGGEEAA